MPYALKFGLPEHIMGGAGALGKMGKLKILTQIGAGEVMRQQMKG